MSDVGQLGAWEVRGGAMREDGLHGVDGYDVWKGDERADDSFFQDRDDAREMADRLNQEDNAMPDLPVTAPNQHHDDINAESTRLLLVRALDVWEKADCDCCSPTILDDAIDRIGYDEALWERMRRFGIELAQTAQNVIDIERTEADA